MKTSRRNVNTHRYTSCRVFLASALGRGVEGGGEGGREGGEQDTT